MLTGTKCFVNAAELINYGEFTINKIGGLNVLMFVEMLFYKKTFNIIAPFSNNGYC